MEIAVRALDLAGVSPERWAGFSATLDETERARAARFHFEHDRQSYIAAHALLRLTLSERAADVRPLDWRFAAASRGKPYLIDPPRDLRFSLTHTRGMVAVAITEGVEIGVDVEASTRRADDMKLAERFFAPEEVALLRAAEGDARRQNFFAIWTLKEAVVKATGQGLAQGLDSFAISLDPPRVAMRGAAEQGEGSSDWSLAHWREGPFHLAVAGRCKDARIICAQSDAAASASR